MALHHPHNPLLTKLDISCSRALCVWALLALLAAPAYTRADALADVQLLRQGGCGGVQAAAAPLQHVERLDHAAAQWARGRSLATAAQRSGYGASQLAGLHFSGTSVMLLQDMRRKSCALLMKSELRDAGVYQHGQDSWLVFAAPYAAPRAPSAISAERVLELVNQVRARGTSCGARPFAAAGPLRSSTVLDRVAYGHAIDMAEHDYFEHRDLAGQMPADRVRAIGYREKLVGENIAFGPSTAEEVVRGWLHSPGHCENIMDARFAEMGIGYAVGQAPEGATGRGLYWVQVLADPKR